MAYTILLGDLVTYCQQLANKVNDNQVDTAEWKAHISTWFGRVHKTVSDVGARVYETDATVSLGSLALPSDHHSTIGVDFVDASGRRRELPELMIQERNIFSGRSGDAIAWSLSGTNLVLHPTVTSSTGTYKHLYIPQPTKYGTAADLTSLDLCTTDGLEAIGWGVASVALHRSESMQQRAIDESNQALGRLKDWAIERARYIPKRRQITSRDMRWGDINGAWNPASWRWSR